MGKNDEDKKKSIRLERVPKVIPTRERMQKMGGVILKNGKVRCRWDSNLEKYHKQKKGFLSRRQFDAGVKLRDAFYLGAMAPYYGASLTEIGFVSGGFTGQNLTDKQIDARGCFHGALDLLPITWQLTCINVCCLDYSLKKCREEFGKSEDVTRDHLENSLTMLADHYQI